MRKWLIRLGVLVGIAAVAWGLRVTVFRPEPVRVRTVAVERGRVESTITNSKAGTVKARRRAKLSPGTSGIVVDVAVERGERIAAGDVVLRIDDASQAAEHERALKALAVAEAVQARACVSAARAKRELERNRKLATDRIVSEDVLDELESRHEVAVADCSVAAAEVESARAAVAVARVELDKTVLTSPFDGIVAEVEVELGEWVTPSVPWIAAPELIDVIDARSLYVAAPMDEVDAAKLAPEQRVRVTIDSYPDRSFPGRVVRVAPYVLDVEQQNRTVEVEVELDDTAFSATLLPGTSADVEVIFEVREDVLRVPTAVLLEGGSVLVLADGRLVERELVLGLRNWDWAEVRGGLAEGDRVVANLDEPGVVTGATAALEGEAGVTP